MADWVNLGDDGEGNIGYINLDRVDMIVHDPKKEMVVLYSVALSELIDESEFAIRKKAMPESYAKVLKYLEKRSVSVDTPTNRAAP